MRIYRLPHYNDDGSREPNPNGDWVVTTTWLGGLIHTSDPNLWKSLRKFLTCARHHISVLHEKRKALPANRT